MLQHDYKSYVSRFKSFGWSVIPVNGHSIPALLKALKKAHSSRLPTIIIAKTFKGQGVSFLKNKENWHGKALSKKEMQKALKEIPNPPMPNISISKPTKLKRKPRTKKYSPNTYPLGVEVATREAYGKALTSLAKSDSRILALDAEVSNSTKSDLVKSSSPKQFLEVFIAEQDLIGISLGLSKKGFKPFASTFSAFLTRAHDQIRMASLSNANFTISGSHSGVSIGEDGASQMGLEDIALFRDLPGSTVLYPSDAVSTEKLMQTAAKNNGITYIRTTRPKTKVLYKKSDSFPLGQFKILKSSSKDSIVLIGSGITLHEALKASALLKSKYKLNTSVLDLYCIKPFNSKALINFGKKHGSKIIIAEDHYKAGGIGEMIASAVENTNIKIKHLYVSTTPHSGTKDQLLEKQKINWQHIALSARLLK
jgi:transketolase